MIGQKQLRHVVFEEETLSPRRSKAVGTTFENNLYILSNSA